MPFPEPQAPYGQGASASAGQSASPLLGGLRWLWVFWIWDFTKPTFGGLLADYHLRAKTRNNFWIPHDLLLLLVYFLLAIVLTWPTITHLSTYLPGDGGDDPAIAWNLWWVKYALLNAGQNPFQTDFMFYPIGINLAFYTLTALNAVTALPLTLNLGVVTASNVHLFFTFAVGGYSAFLLARYVLTTADRRPPTAEKEAMDGGQRSVVSGLPWMCAAIAGQVR